MPTVPKINGGRDRIALPDEGEFLQQRAAPKQPIEKRAQQTVDLAELLALTRGMPAKERAETQRQLLADPRAWTGTEWLED